MRITSTSSPASRLVMTRLPVLGELRRFSCSFTTATFSFLGAVVGAVVGTVEGSVEGSDSTMLGIFSEGSVASVEGSVFLEEGSREHPLRVASISARTSARLTKRPRDFFFVKG